MSGEVLYRKWRPPRFADIVGQNAITQTLTQAVATDRTSHAYLLCGPRGTGKTSTARVLAKALNCTMRPPGVGDPCGACDSCRAIDQGSYVDLIEIDAASNRGIDEMRDLREKVRFSPTQGKYKVYIIDEAHALTNDAFNAFLKTLEEPPPHSVFVLATTEAHRLPATIVSRCQRFDFHRIAPSDVVDRLAKIATAEGVDISPEVLRTISRASGGSLRDATNLLDQLITSFGANVSIEQVHELLGMGGEDRALALVKHLLTNNTKAALELINTVTSEGQDIRPLHRMTVDFLRAALLMKSGVTDALELSKEAYAELSFASSNTTLDHLLRALRMFGQVSLKFDQPSPLPLELAAVELSLEPTPVVAAAAPPPRAAPTQRAPQPAPQQQAPRAPMPPQRDVPANAQPYNTSPQPRPQQQPPAQRPAPAQARADAQPAPTQAAPVFDPSASVDERLAAQWPAILRGLSRVPKKRFDVAALLRSSIQHVIEGSDLVVRFTHTSNSERLQAELDSPQCRIEVERILAQALGEGFSLRIEADESRRSVARSSADQPGHLVRAAMSLGGQVIQNGVPVTEPTAPPAPEPPATDTPVAEVASRPDVAAPSSMEEPATEVADPLAESEPMAEPTPVEDEPPVATADAAPEAVVPPIEPPVEQVEPPAGEAVAPASDPVAEPAPVENGPTTMADPVYELITPPIEAPTEGEVLTLTYEPIPAVAEPAPEPTTTPEAPPEPASEPSMANANTEPQPIEPSLDEAAPNAEVFIEPTPAADEPPPPAEEAPPASTNPANSVAEPESEPPVVEAPSVETPIEIQNDAPPSSIEPPATNEPSMSDDLSSAPAEPEPVPAAAQPGPMFDFGALTEPSKEESNNE